MSEPFEIPDGQEVEVEFIRPDKPNQRGILPLPIDFDSGGFEVIELSVPDNLGFGEPFRLELRLKWLNLSTVAEVRYLPPGTLRAEADRLRALHGEVRARMRRSPEQGPG